MFLLGGPQTVCQWRPRGLIEQPAANNAPASQGRHREPVIIALGQMHVAEPGYAST